MFFLENLNQLGLQIQRKLTFYVSLANLHRNYFCQLIIHTHTNSRQSKLYILSYSVGWNWIMVSDEKKSLVVMILVKSTTFFLFMPTYDLLVQGRYLIMVFYFISIFLSSNQKKNLKKSCSFGVGQNFLYIFLLFSHKVSKVLKLSAINKYHLTWGIYTSHSFLKIKNLIVSMLLKKMFPSNTIILVIWSVKIILLKSWQQI